MAKEAIEKFKTYYERCEFHDIEELKKVYSENIKFKDPIHQIEGIQKLDTYFKKMDRNLVEGTFHFKSTTFSENSAHLGWDMEVLMKSPAKWLKVSGVTYVEFDDKITHHVDYFDAGAMFYENVPILSKIIRFVKLKIAN